MLLMGRKITFSQGEFYHLYNRGIEQRVIFQDDNDHKRFVALLSLSNTTSVVNFGEHFQFGGTYAQLFDVQDDPLVAIGAYCLMPNHFHVLVKEIRKGGISAFMHKLATAYSMYFNAKYSRKGRLFEGTFCARHVADDNYLKYLFAYIHLNPVKIVEPGWKKYQITDRTRAKKFVATYPYSSFLDYVPKMRIENRIISRHEFPDYFDKKGDFESYLNDWLNFSEHDLIKKAKPLQRLNTKG